MSNQSIEKEVVLMLTDTTIRRLETLGDLAKQGKRINGIFRLMESRVLWLQAYANLHGNKGAATPGIDNSSLDGFSEERINRIVAALKSGEYRFAPVRRVHIPKSNGKTRPLGIPSGDDKLVQEVVRMILEKIYEPIFSNDSHGFRNGRSCHTALMQVRHKWTGMKWIVNMDIKGYFDNIDHETMEEILAKRIEDPRFLGLIKAMLKAGYVEDWRYHETFSGTPQGGVASPILANIYLHELDEFMAGKIADFNRGKRRAVHHEYKNLCESIKRKMKRIDLLKQVGSQQVLAAEMRELSELDKQRKGLPSIDPLDAKYRRLTYIRYADDFLIGVIGSRSEAVSVMQNVADFLRDELKLEIASDKSGVVHATEGVRFLGFDVSIYSGNRIVKTTRSGRHTTMRSVSGRMQLHIPQEKLRKFCEAKGYGVYDTFTPKHRNALIHLSEAEIVQTFNAEMRGLANYYGIAVNAKRDLNKLHGLWQGSLLKTLAAKRKSSVEKVAQSLRQEGGSWALVVSGKANRFAFPIYSLKMMGDQPVIFEVVDIEPKTWHLTLSNTELVQRMAACECEYCGDKSGPFEVHHIRKLADVGNGKKLWQIMMARRQRTTLVMCRPCHKALHAGTL
jgi:group II intron reverse transcriptase/maturase